MWKEIVIEEASSTVFVDDEIRAFELKWGITFPEDHRQFLIGFGEGVLYNHVRVFGLRKIDEEAEQFQDRWQEYFLWEDEKSALSEDVIGACVIVGDTFNGDEFVLSPGHPGEIFYLPQDASVIENLGASLAWGTNHIIQKLRAEISRYPEDEQEEWDLRPVFNVRSF